MSQACGGGFGETGDRASAGGGHGKISVHCTLDSFSMIELIINGKPERLDDAPTVLALLEARQLAGKRLAVERNGEIVPKGQHAHTLLADGDRLEIVVAVGGG